MRTAESSSFFGCFFFWPCGGLFFSRFGAPFSWLGGCRCFWLGLVSCLPRFAWLGFFWLLGLASGSACFGLRCFSSAFCRFACFWGAFFSLGPARPGSARLCLLLWPSALVALPLFAWLRPSSLLSPASLLAFSLAFFSASRFAFCWPGGGCSLALVGCVGACSRRVCVCGCWWFVFCCCVGVGSPSVPAVWCCCLLARPPLPCPDEVMRDGC